MYDLREKWKRREEEILGYGEKGASATDQFFLIIGRGPFILNTAEERLDFVWEKWKLVDVLTILNLIFQKPRL